MMELIFLVSLGILLYHLYRLLNANFDIKRAIIFLIAQLILFGYFLLAQLASVAYQVYEYKIAVMLSLVTIIFIVEFILFSLSYLLA
jgi:hypothetical protein